MLRSVVLLCAVFVFVKGQTTDVSQCVHNAGDRPINAYIAGCVTPPCQLPQLQNAVINIIFQAPYIMRDMRTVATAYLPSLFGEIPIPYNLQENALTCNFLTNTYCPVVQDEVIQYVLNMYIEPIFPVGIQANIEFRITDDNNVAIVCIRVPILITAPIAGASNETATVDEY